MLFLSLAPDHVYDKKDHHPHHVHEVPIHRQNIGAFGVLFSHFSPQGESQYRPKRKQADYHVKRMEADEGVLSGSEKVGLDCQTILINHMSPLPNIALEYDPSHHHP